MSDRKAGFASISFKQACLSSIEPLKNPTLLEGREGEKNLSAGAPFTYFKYNFE